MSPTKRRAAASCKRQSIASRKNKVHLEDFASLPADFSWYRSLAMMIPRVLRGRDLESLTDAITSARREGRPVVFMMGAHAVKCGLGGLLCELLRRGVVTRLAVNGACAIHDFEIAMWGKTSEDVVQGLKQGVFGTTEETARFFNTAARTCLRKKIGLGRSLGEALSRGRAPNSTVSLLATAHQLGLPLTVHVAIGTDVVHQDPKADGRAIGYGTMADFRSFVSGIVDLRGGVVVNIGSAVVMPEVFLKAVAITRSRGIDLGSFTTANFDMFPLYRPTTNVVERPRLLGARAYNFIGSHELTLPLLVASLMSQV
ncbi:MAG: hypothetical protein WAW06_11380 [bacterium]